MSNAGRYLGPHIRTGANSYTLAPIPITAPRLTPISNLGRVSAGINDEYRRGTSLGSDKLNPLTPFIWDDFVSEHRYKKLIIDEDYSNVFDGLNDRTVKDIEKRRELSKQSQNHAAINAAQKDLEVTVKAIEEKAVEYDRLTKDAHSLYGLNPLFLMIDLPFRKIYEGVHRGVESFNKALSDIDAAYKAALEQKRISLESNTLASQLPLLALNIEQLAQSSPNDSDRVASWTSDSLSVINVEKNIRLSLLAYFLQDSIVNAAGALEGLTRSEALEKYLVALDSKVASEKSAIGSYTKANPNIKSPLSKPELEALHTLIELQSTTELGKRWLDYHIYLLHSETARQLTDTSNAFKNMLARAKEAEAKQAADQQKKDYLDALSFVAAANERALQTYGEQLGSIAKELQADVSGKNVRSYSEALATVEKIRANPKFRLNIQDRQATVNAINALDKATFAENINRLGKAFGVVGKIVQAKKIYDTTVHGFQTEDWKPLMLELEALALGIGAGALVVVGMAFFFPVFTVTTLGIIAVAMILALVSSLIDSKLADRINNVIFS